MRFIKKCEIIYMVRRGSPVVARTLGKGEVESSILSHGTENNIYNFLYNLYFSPNQR